MLVVLSYVGGVICGVGVELCWWSRAVVLE